MYDVWNLAPPKLPPRSRLHSLPPIGMGTPSVESLTSYMMRLAGTHTVSVRTLIQQEIFPSLSTSPKDTHFLALRSLNGMGTCFEQWVGVLDKLTGRNDLRALTLLPWQSLLACGGILRRHRAWCPSCLQEWRHRAAPIYECLLWTLTPVTICPIHDVPLEQHCPHCRQRMLPLSAHARPGFCAHCNRWVGNLLPSKLKQPQKDQLWVAKTLGEFLALGIAGNLKSSPCHLLSNLQGALSDFADGNQRLFSRVVQVSAAFPEWVKQNSFLSLPVVIRISQNLRLPLSRLVFEEISSADPEWIQASQTVAAQQAAFVARTKVLKTALEEPPVPLVILASRLRKDPNWLRVAFPDLCRRLRSRYLAHQSSQQQEVRLLYENATRQAIREITDANEYPSQQRVLSFMSKRNPSLTSFYLTGLAIKSVCKKLEPSFHAASALDADLQP